MTETAFQIARSVAFAASFALVFAAQSLWPYRRVATRVPANWRPNLPLALLNTVVTALVCGGCLCAVARFAETRGLGLLGRVGAPAWLALAVTFVALDLTLWLWHRANHRLGWLWRFHRVHHSDRVFDVSTALRFHAGELLLSLPVKGLVIVLLGAPVAGVLLFEALFGFFNMFVHGNLRLPARAEGALSALLILPAAHRRHHAIAGADRQSNFGTVLSLWDRLFGTWRAARSSEAVVVGLESLRTGAAPSLLRCLTLPFAPLAAGEAGGTGALEQRGELR